jgi:hypothetical protein
MALLIEVLIFLADTLPIHLGKTVVALTSFSTSNIGAEGRAYTADTIDFVG